MNLQGLIKTTKDWLNREDYSDELVTSWIRMAEQDLSTRLRCSDMVRIVTAMTVGNRVTLPLDWQESDFIRDAAGKPLLFKPRDEFYSGHDKRGYYTITGRYLMVGGQPTSAEPANIELSYYASIPPLGNTPNFMTTRYFELMTVATVARGEGYGLNDERTAIMLALVGNYVEAINNTNVTNKTNGSVLVAPRKKGFG